MAGKFFSKIFSGLAKTREQISGRLDELVSYYKEIDDEFFEDLEDVLIGADVGAAVAVKTVERLRTRIKAEKIGDKERIVALLKEELIDLLGDSGPESYEYPLLILITGVNGVGKTTAIGKLAYRFANENKKVLLAAGDTFRAAAADQLAIWAERTGADIVRQHEGADPAAVIFDAIAAGKARKADVILCDTAGRLHNKKNLMDELAKIGRIVDREFTGCRRNYIVLDGTTGQNAVVQAEAFAKVTGLDGVILTKLDGTAKGGVVLAVSDALKIPVRYIGVGEGKEDLQEFNKQDYIDSLF